MRFVFMVFVCLMASSSLAEVANIQGQDAINVCASLRSIYSLQAGELASYPLARVIQLKKEQAGVVEYSIGSSDEKITCRSSIYYRPGSSHVQEEVKVLYNGEVSRFEKVRTLSEWSLFKVYEITGFLAQVVCAQFEEFDAVEEQAGLDPLHQVFSSMSAPGPNIFDVVPTVIIDKGLLCGSRDGEKVLQIQSQDAI